MLEELLKKWKLIIIIRWTEPKERSGIWNSDPV